MGEAKGEEIKASANIKDSVSANRKLQVVIIVNGNVLHEEPVMQPALTFAHARAHYAHRNTGGPLCALSRLEYIPVQGTLERWEGIFDLRPVTIEKVQPARTVNSGESRKQEWVRISCSRQAQAKSTRDIYHGLSHPSRPSKRGRIPCQYAAPRSKVSPAVAL